MPIKKFMVKIIIGCDHGGFKFKEKIKKFLEEKDYIVEDVNPDYEPADDYPDFAAIVAEKVSNKEGEGILICSSGVGMTLVANKFSGIRATLCRSVDDARYAKEHNDSNILTLGGLVTAEEDVLDIVKIWLETKFSGDERHVRRLDKIKDIEKKTMK